jgi:hypothetical protein
MPGRWPTLKIGFEKRQLVTMTKDSSVLLTCSLARDDDDSEVVHHRQTVAHE